MEFSGLFYLSNHTSFRPPWGEGWLLASGDGKFQSTASGGYRSVEGVIGEIDGDGVVSQGASEKYTTAGSYGLLISCFGPSPSYFVSAIDLTTEIMVSNISGLSIGSRFFYELTDPDFRGINGYGDDLIYVEPVDKWLLASYAQPAVDKLMALEISPSSVTELGLSTDLLFPEDVYPVYPSRMLGRPVGQGGDVVYTVGVNDYRPGGQDSMVFTRAKVDISGNIAINFGFISTDINGISIGLAGDKNSDGFVAVYKTGNSIKAVYGKLSGDNDLIFGLPVTLAAGTVYDQGHACWQQGVDSVVAVINYEDSGTDMVSVVRIEVSPDSLQVEPIWEDSYSFPAYLDERISISFDESINRVVIGMIGGGVAPMPENHKIYILSAEGALPTSFFWHNHTLQREGSEELVKVRTDTVIPGRLGQPYLPPRATVGPSVAVSERVNYVCERVI